MNLCKGQNPPFPIFDLGGGGGRWGSKFPFYFVQDCNHRHNKMEQQKPQQPKIKDEAAWQPKHGIFKIFLCVVRGV